MMMKKLTKLFALVLALALHLAKMTPMLANIDAESLDLSGVTEITVDETMIVGTIKREEEL